MATIDLKLKSYDELQFEIMRLNTDNYLKQQKIDLLTNNWNELEELIKFQRKVSLGLNNGYGVSLCDIFLDKMKEIKEGNKCD